MANSAPYSRSKSAARAGAGLLMIGMASVPLSGAVAATWLEQTVGNAGRALADGVTFGETGRDRDRARAAAAERLAAEQRAATERERAAKVQTLTNEAGTLSGIVERMKANCGLVDAVLDVQERLIAAARAELAARAKAETNAEMAQDALRMSEKDLAGLATALQALNYLSANLSTAPNDSTGDAERRKNALATAQQVLRTADLDNATGGTYLDRSVRNLKTSNLASLMQAVGQSRAHLLALKGSLDNDRETYYARLLAKQQELGKLKTS